MIASLIQVFAVLIGQREGTSIILSGVLCGCSEDNCSPRWNWLTELGEFMRHDSSGCVKLPQVTELEKTLEIGGLLKID